MNKSNIKISKDFKSQTVKAIISISFFILVYLIIISLVLCLTLACIASGIVVIVVYPSLMTILLGLGFGTMGVLMLVFVLKFIFKSYKTERNNMIEIKSEDEPELFKMINQLVEEIGTNFPKKVYLTNDVNAAVFYDSNFWSMFFPVKKNLMIGIGLVNAVTKDELKAILAHEFGHFSQKSMKVGAYTYNLNKIIFNMLYDNATIDKIAINMASISGITNFFVNVAIKIIQFILWILMKLYEIMNKSYMALSREMEFHADEIAASVTGHEALSSSLLRLQLADFSYQNVLMFYESKIHLNQKSENIYKDHLFTMNLFATDNKIPIKNNLPLVTLNDLNKFNKSKLYIKDQWASHPSIEDRIKRLKATDFISDKRDNTLASELFKDIEQTQSLITFNLFKEVKYKEETSFITPELYQTLYKENIENNSFPKIYNCYYDNKNPIYFDIKSLNSSRDKIEFNELFFHDKIDLVYTFVSLSNDLETLKLIQNKTIPIKSFDYDGIKYKSKKTKELIPKLEKELDGLINVIKSNDEKIYLYFKNLETTLNNSGKLDNLYNYFFEFDKVFLKKHQFYIDINESLQFLNHSIPIEYIISNFKEIEPSEIFLKKEIEQFLNNPKLESEMNFEMKENFKTYISNNLEYTVGNDYKISNLEIFIKAINDSQYILQRKYFVLKKEILDYQFELYQKS